MTDLDRDDWGAYFEATLDKPLHPIYERLAPHLPGGGTALELGCGVGTGVLWLLDQGVEVIAVDRDERALEIVAGRLHEAARCRLVHADFEAFSPPRVEVVVAAFSLFFLPPPVFEEFWVRVRRALLPGGLFAGQLLGVHDEWRSRGYTVQTAEEVRTLLDGFEILDWEEADRPGKTALGEEKHWHVFHVVARKGHDAR
jgi:SAM-dependent methyltransferase